jgi:hypothetical protein
MIYELSIPDSTWVLWRQFFTANPAWRSFDEYVNAVLLSALAEARAVDEALILQEDILQYRIRKKNEKKDLNPS